MSPNSRPPLTSRIRASFESKRTKSADFISPTHPNGFVTHDAESLRNAIDQAINSDTFQNAIASNLARLLKPSIKDALDTIQPMVEAVYSHEILLRRTNASVENILERFNTAGEEERAGPTAGDERKAPATPETDVGESTAPPNIEHIQKLFEENGVATAAKLSELSSSVEASNNRIAELVGGVAGVQTALGRTREGIDSLKLFSEQSNTTTSVMQAQLDQLQADIGLIIDATGSDLGANIKALGHHVTAQTKDTSLLSSHATKLDTIASDLAALKVHSNTVEKLDTISANVEALRENVQAGIASSNDHFATLTPQLTNVVCSVEAQASAIAEIKAADASPQILAAVQKSNESHACHAECLEGIRSLSTAPPNLEPHIARIINTLESHTTALGELKSSNGASGSEILPANINDNLESLGPHMTTIINILESHTSILNELKDDVSAEILTALHEINDSNANQHAAINEIREADVSDEILTALHSSNDSHTNHAAVLAQIHAAVKVSNDSHVVHTTALDEIKAARSGKSGVSTEPGNVGTLEEQIGAIAATLEDQNQTLSTIKDAANASMESHTAHAAALNDIRDASAASNKSHASHTSALEELKEGVSASRDSYATHSANLGESKDATTASKEFHTSHAASLVEIRAIQSGQPSKIEGVANKDAGDLEGRLSTIVNSLETHSETLSEIKAATTNPGVLAALKESHELLNSNHAILTVHTSMLDSIKDGNSHEDILANIASLKSIIEEAKGDIGTHGAAVKDLHESTKASHSEITTAISALGLGGAVGAGAGYLTSKAESKSSAEVLEEVKAVRAIVEKSSHIVDSVKETTTSTAAQIDINHTTVITSITTLSDELKAEIDASGTEIASSITALSGDVEGIDIKSLSATVHKCRKEINEMNFKVEELAGHVQNTGPHVAKLIQGVHLNEKGLGQLKEHVRTNATTANGFSRDLDSGQIMNRKDHLEQTDLLSGKPKPTKVEGAKVEPEAEPESVTEKTKASDAASQPAHNEAAPVPAEIYVREEAPIQKESTSLDKETTLLQRESTRVVGDEAAATPEFPPVPETEQELAEESKQGTGSASISAIASPSSSSFPESSNGKKGKKGKKDKEKKPKKDKKVPFVFDPEDEEGSE